MNYELLRSTGRQYSTFATVLTLFGIQQCSTFNIVRHSTVFYIQQFVSVLHSTIRIQCSTFNNSAVFYIQHCSCSTFNNSVLHSTIRQCSTFNIVQCIQQFVSVLHSTLFSAFNLVLHSTMFYIQYDDRRRCCVGDVGNGVLF